MNQDVRSAPISALIFDMDGLLVDSETAAAGALRIFLAEFDRTLEPATVEQSLGKRLPEAIAAIAELHQLPGSIAELTARYDAMRLEALRGAVTAMVGAADLLRWARDNELKVALATSSFRSHADVSLAEAQLCGLFDVEVTGDEVRAGKPAPESLSPRRGAARRGARRVRRLRRCASGTRGGGAGRYAAGVGAQRAYPTPHPARFGAGDAGDAARCRAVAQFTGERATPYHTMKPSSRQASKVIRWEFWNARRVAAG